MPSPLEVVAQTQVRATPERVWAVAMDWSRQGEWIPGTQVSGGTGVGAQVIARTAIGRVGFTDTMIITEWDPPRRCVVRHTGKVVRGLGIFEVTGRGPGSEFRWTERLQLPWPLSGWLGRLLVVPVARRSLAASLGRLAR